MSEKKKNISSLRFSFKCFKKPYFTEKIFHLESPPLLDLPKSHPYLLDKLSKKDMWAP